MKEFKQFSHAIHWPLLFVKGIGASFLSLYIFLRQLPIYLRAPKILQIEFILFYLYNVYYSYSKNLMEKQKTGLDITELTYGETSYLSLDQALSVQPPHKKSLFIDLGCGKGKTVFFTRFRYGCRSVGIDVVPSYIKFASKLCEKMGIRSVRFLEKNILDARIQKATHVLLTMTSFKEKTRRQLYLFLQSLPRGCIVICVSGRLPKRDFVCLKSFYGLCSWGKTAFQVYQRR